MSNLVTWLSNLVYSMGYVGKPCWSCWATWT